MSRHIVNGIEQSDGPDASTTLKGVIELATDAETVTGTSDSVVTTPGNITARLAAPGEIGGTTPAAGNFTTLSASGIINGLTEPRLLTNCEGSHDSTTSATVMTDSGESLTVDAYIGMTIYNTTDGSHGTVIDNAATTITVAALTGGTDNQWENGDGWAVAPGPSQSGTIFYISGATTILHPATAKYSAMYYSTAANTIKVDPQSAWMVITLDGTALTAGNEIDSEGSAGDYIAIHNYSATLAYTLGRSGTWADGGAS